MWTRELLKRNARNVIARRGWPVMYGAALIVALLSGLDFGVNTEFTSSGMRFTTLNLKVAGLWQYSVQMNRHLSAGMWLTVALLSLASGLLALFVGSVIHVGYQRFLMESRQGEAPFSTIFSVFGPGYWNVLWAEFTTGLCIVLWGFLLIIPGIIKLYEYGQVSYLLAENPYLSGSRARQLSSRMTMGEKKNIFVLDLTFLGWQIAAGLMGGLMGLLLPAVGVLSGGLLALAVSVYINSTHAELYAALRAKADALGMVGEEELTGFMTY